MRPTKVVSIAAAFAIALALAGCGRFAAGHIETPAVSQSPSVSSDPSPRPPTSLSDIDSDLDSVDGAIGQADADLSDGDQAAQQDDSQ